MEEVAVHFARLCRLPLIDVLVRDRRKGADQRGLSRVDRRLNARAAFRIPDDDATVRQRLRELAGKRVILIDDVFTTGMTLDAAARALLDRGVCEVRVCVLARVW
jgi:predicted amidophosphoribosyltransferase